MVWSKLMKKEYIIFEPKDELGTGFKIIKSDDNTLITFEKYGKYNTSYMWEHVYCLPEHLDKVIEVLQKIKMNVKAVKGFEKDMEEFYEKSNKS